MSASLQNTPGQSVFGGHLTLLIDKLNEREPVAPSDNRIVLTEGGSNVDYAGTVIHRYIVRDGDIPALFGGRNKIEERLVLGIFEIFSDIFGDDFVLTFAENAVAERSCKDEYIIAVLYADVFLDGIHAERNV